MFRDSFQDREVAIGDQEVFPKGLERPPIASRCHSRTCTRSWT